MKIWLPSLAAMQKRLIHNVQDRDFVPAFPKEAHFLNYRKIAGMILGAVFSAGICGAQVGTLYGAPMNSFQGSAGVATAYNQRTIIQGTENEDVKITEEKSESAMPSGIAGIASSGLPQPSLLKQDIVQKGVQEEARQESLQGTDFRQHEADNLSSKACVAAGSAGEIQNVVPPSMEAGVSTQMDQSNFSITHEESLEEEKASLNEELADGITAAFKTAPEEIAQAASSTLWAGTPLEGYVNIGIVTAKGMVDIHESPNAESSLTGKIRPDAAFEVLGYEGDKGEWIHITSGDVEGYLPAEAVCTGDKAANLALDLGQELALVTADSLYVRAEPDEASEEFTSIQKGEYLTVLDELDGWVKVEIDDEPGYVKAEYVDVSCKLDTALTMTEVNYGEGVSEERVAICDFAKRYVGNPYVWGGVSLTNGADCSGFVLSVFHHFGISLPHSSKAQANCGTNISVSELLPGDLVFYGNSGIGHVAIYIGNGQIVHASNSRTGIIISSVNYRTPVRATRLVYS